MKTNEQRMNEEKNEYRKAMVKHGGQKGYGRTWQTDFRITFMLS